MPVDFLTEEQKSRYGKYQGEPSVDQLARYFHLDDHDLSVISRKRGPHNKLGFGLQLATVRFLGTFLNDPTEVPQVVVSFIAKQLEIDTEGCLGQYLKRPATHHAHATEIRKIYGYYEFNDPSWHFQLVRWLYGRIWLSNERPSVLFDLSTAWLAERKILLPGVSTLTRLIAQIRDRTTNRIWQMLADLPTAEQANRLESLLRVLDGQRQSALDRLRRGPTRVSGPALNRALHRYEEIRSLGIRPIDISHIPPARIRLLARYAATAWAPLIERMPEKRRIATLVAFIYTFEAKSLDDALDLLDMLITDITSQAQKIGQKQRLRTLRDLDKASLKLGKACAMLLDQSINDVQIRRHIFKAIPEKQIHQAVEQVFSLARPYDDKYLKELVDRYRRVRVFLPTLLKTVTFQATASGKPTLQALRFLSSIEGHQKPDMSRAPMKAVSSTWRRLMVDQDGNISRPAYTLCILQQLQDNLRRRDIFVPESDRWSDPRRKLLRGAEWDSKRSQVCRSLSLPNDGDKALKDLEQQLDAAYLKTVENFPNNQAVRIEHVDGKPDLILSGLEKLNEPPSLIELREHVASLLPRVDLPDLLLEIHARTGFADEFTHISEGNARVKDLAISICAVLMAEACNIGLEPLIQPDQPALSRNRLSWIQQNFIRAETLTRANARLVDYQTTIPLARKWGGGEVASADGLRFATPIRTINSGPNPKYFGFGRGITYYNFTSDQYGGVSRNPRKFRPL